MTEEQIEQLRTGAIKTIARLQEMARRAPSAMEIGVYAQQSGIPECWIRALDEREKSLGAIFLLLEDEPEDHEHFGCDRAGAECSWCYARKVYEEARR